MNKLQITVILLLMQTLSFAQLTLENTYYSSPTNNDGDKNQFFNTQNASYHYVVDSNLNLTIFTESQQVHKVVNLSAVAPGNNFHSVLLFTDKLFNSDNLIEFIYISYLPNTQIVMKLVNENGEVLQDLGYKNYAAIVKNSNGDFKLITKGGIEKKVYALPGALLSSQTYLLSNKIIGYPNPATDVINITNPSGKNAAEIKIYSIDGKEIKKITQTDNDGFFSLDVSELAAGTYIYKIGNYSNKFVKE
nr:T9SS type A sorting domain-containing protein [uncultured Flavobacterium sp.]